MIYDKLAGTGKPVISKGIYHRKPAQVHAVAQPVKINGNVIRVMIRFGDERFAQQIVNRNPVSQRVVNIG